MEHVADRLDQINRMVGLTTRWFALLMVLLQFGIVLLRYVFGFSSIALNESVLYLHAGLFMLGSGFTLMMDGHVRVDIFYAKWSARGKARLNMLGHLFLLIPSMIALLYWSWPSVRNSWAIWEGPLSVGGIPALWLMKSLIPAFCVLLLIQSLALIARQLVLLTHSALNNEPDGKDAA